MKAGMFSDLVMLHQHYYATIVGTDMPGLLRCVTVLLQGQKAGECGVVGAVMLDAVRWCCWVACHFGKIATKCNASCYGCTLIADSTLPFPTDW